MLLFRRLLVALLLPLAACAVPGPNADDASLQAARYVSDAPTSITLYTVINNRTGAGAHSALLVNASESVLFDPAGSFKLAAMPERGDVLYGATPRWMLAYVDYHARDTHHMRSATLQVPPEVAEQILRAVKANGAVAQAHCANSISRLLGQVPGFGQITRTYFPLKLEAAFVQNPNVTVSTVYDETADKSHGVQFVEPKG
jgi:hypothetical protein